MSRSMLLNLELDETFLNAMRAGGVQFNGATLELVNVNGSVFTLVLSDGRRAAVYFNDPLRRSDVGSGGGAGGVGMTGDCGCAPPTRSIICPRCHGRRPTF